MQTPVKMRKNAKQTRAKHTVAAILEATTQLLEQGDIDQISTNHIAERAGVSIGTLYQYFPNKTAIFVAIAEQDIAHRFDLVATVIKQSDKEDADLPIRKLMRAFIQSFTASAHSAALIKILMTVRASTENRPLPVDAIARLLSDIVGRDGKTRPLTEASAFVLTRATLWTILTATIDAPHLLKTRAFEDELVFLVRALLGTDPSKD